MRVYICTNISIFCTCNMYLYLCARESGHPIASVWCLNVYMYACDAYSCVSTL